MSDKSMADCKQRDCNYAMRAGCAPRLLTLFKFSKYQLIRLYKRKQTRTSSELTDMTEIWLVCPSGCSSLLLQYFV